MNYAVYWALNRSKEPSTWAGQARAKRLAEITAHLDSLGDDELDHRLRQYQRVTGRLRMGKTNHRG